MHQNKDTSLIYVVDDDEGLVLTLSTILQWDGFSVRTYTDPVKALESARIEPPDLLVSDVDMPRMTGVRLASQMRKLCPNCRLLLVSGLARPIAHLEAAKEQGYDVHLVPKALDLPTFLRTVNAWLGTKGRVMISPKRIGKATINDNMVCNGVTLLKPACLAQAKTAALFTPQKEVRTTASRTNLPRGSETILVVDDLAALVEMTKVFLVMQGYTVYTALNGVEALIVLAAKGAQIALVFTDVVMPLMGGPELARKVNQLYPKIKVLFASGYVGQMLEQYGMTPEPGRFIEKPYNFGKLSSNIRELLDSCSNAPLPA